MKFEEFQNELAKLNCHCRVHFRATYKGTDIDDISGKDVPGNFPFEDLDYEITYVHHYNEDFSNALDHMENGQFIEVASGKPLAVLRMQNMNIKNN